MWNKLKFLDEMIQENGMKRNMQRLVCIQLINFRGAMPDTSVTTTKVSNGFFTARRLILRAVGESEKLKISVYSSKNILGSICVIQ